MGTRSNAKVQTHRIPIGELKHSNGQRTRRAPLVQTHRIPIGELRCPAYVRYVDDLLLFADDKATLWAWKAALIERLTRLRLTIHPGAHPCPVTEGIPFLGFVVYPTHRRLKSRNVVAYWRRWRALLEAFVAGKETQDAVVASFRGWTNHARYGDTWALRKAVARQAVF